MRILLVEDDQALAESLSKALAQHSLKVDRTRLGEEAWALASTETYSAAVLDLNLPDVDGLEVLRRWREEGVDTPVLILSARGSWAERVKGLNLGADDYLAKPFRMEELVARIFAIIRRIKGDATMTVTAQGVTADLSNAMVHVDDRDVELSPLEFRTLTHLMLNKGRAVPLHELMDVVYGVNAGQSSNALEAIIRRIRVKVGSPLIRTRRGIGYVIDDK